MAFGDDYNYSHASWVASPPARNVDSNGVPITDPANTALSLASPATGNDVKVTAGSSTQVVPPALQPRQVTFVNNGHVPVYVSSAVQTVDPKTLVPTGFRIGAGETFQQFTADGYYATVMFSSTTAILTVFA